MDRAELTKMLKRLGWILGIFVAAGLIISAVERKEASNISEVYIEIEPLEGEHLLITPEEVRTAIDRSFGFRLEGLPQSAVDIERLERVLEEEPFILDAEAYIDGKNRIQLQLEQREPVLRVIDNNGLNYYLDASGLKMPLSRHFTARVLVATGHIPPHVPDFLERRRHKLKDLFLLAQHIREDLFLQPLIEQVYLNQRGEFILVPKVGDHKIILGAVDKLDQKFKKLLTFYREALPYEGWRKYRTVNLAFDGQVVCQKW